MLCCHCCRTVICFGLSYIRFNGHVVSQVSTLTKSQLVRYWTFNISLSFILTSWQILAPTVVELQVALACLFWLDFVGVEFVKHITTKYGSCVTSQETRFFWQYYKFAQYKITFQVWITIDVLVKLTGMKSLRCQLPRNPFFFLKKR